MSKRDRAQATIQLEIKIQRSYTVAVVVSITIVAILVCALFVVEYKRRVKVSGRIVPTETTIRVVAPQNGVIAKSLSLEGKSVTKGDALFTISAERSNVGGSVELAAMGNIAHELRNLKGQLGTNRSISVLQQQQKREEITGIRNQIANVDEEIQTHAIRIQISRENLQRFEEMSKTGYISQIQLLQRKDEWLGFTTRMNQLKREKYGLITSLANAETQLRLALEQVEMDEYKINTVYSNLKRESAEVDIRREQIVIAPITGTITAVQAVEGQTVTSNQPILAIIPKDASLVAKVTAPSAAMGFLDIGQEVFVRFSAFPYQKFGSYRGKVKAFNIAAIAVNAEKSTDSFYEITIELDKQTVMAYGKTTNIKPDMVVEVDIVTETRTLIEWIFEPLFAISKR